MTFDDRQFFSIGQVQDQYLNPNVQKPGKKPQSIPTGENSFAQILNKVKETVDNNSSTENLKFSKHAVNRLNDRNIALTADQMDRLSKGTAEAQEKGIKDSLILIDQLAFIVNIPNNTVVTAMDQTENKSNVFTNIDGAVIA
ncbi:TIGR02530 family flagellar biosynthesis protein [Butyrivibrio proteoclasticus]|uniref:TIGR02530 family flagellar biosynthesis protein n=1 Tax=Butyrivibrio proteoclasticus TaxID=43305 RepID=UPI00047B536E|nr:TIGR02530 family flagellar biosynthesis protein [Butyrivibrio proteoclasticus]